MGKTKLIAKFIAFFSRVLAIAYLLMAVYSSICLTTKCFVTPYGNGQYLHINYPFSQKPFLNVDNNASYIFFSFLLPIILYALFFLLTGNLFAVFSKTKLFTHYNLSELKKFYLFNWFIPFPAIIISSFFVEIINMIWLLAIIHCIFGIFTWMVAAIFKQGLRLQNEQDLFI
ncbi:Protein of unknown function (DUF2975) [Lacibacter cauensis]|uniref:DUF2975 family protein n=1 Tax=Lacibacter cauensis TaxID=510947 RepID=A0A562SYW1_9BACT|nr:DUF2975 domain-containing protein [Lacibacter cauensis]TWI85820.1 Protein of unknown function (DUF2975) [Lacibacter cauensis]